MVLGKNQSSVPGLSELRAYWGKALQASSEVHFELESIGVGGDALTMIYRNQRNDHVAETLVFGDEGKVLEGIVTYLKQF